MLPSLVCSDGVVTLDGGAPVPISPGGDPIISGGTTVGDADGVLSSIISPDGDVVCSDVVVPPDGGVPVLVSAVGDPGGTAVGDADGVLLSLVCSDGVVTLDGGAPVPISPGGDPIVSGGTAVGDADCVLPSFVSSDGVVSPDGGVPILVGDPIMSGGTVVGEVDGMLPSYISMGGEVMCSDGVVPPGGGSSVFAPVVGESIISNVGDNMFDGVTLSFGCGGLSPNVIEGDAVDVVWPIVMACVSVVVPSGTVLGCSDLTITDVSL